MTEAQPGAAGAPQTGALLVNLGTPDSPAPRDVRRYLAEFLSDPRVLTVPAPIRWLLLHGIILRTRPRKSAEAYAQIWSPAGSPLLVHGRALRDRVENALGPGMPVVLAMRYGRPDVDGALAELMRAGVRRVVVLPLFPQYSEAATGSALAHVRARAARLDPQLELIEVPEFHANPGFVEATAALARPVMEEVRAEHVLLSYHGLPESQVRRNPGCLARPDCCDAPGERLAYCYRAQCFATSRALIGALGLAPDRCTTAFQSRLGPTRWIGPYTDAVLATLRERGIRRIAVVCPAFVADCLETLEEIGIRLREQWDGLGGEAFGLVPCVNAHPRWVEAAAELLRDAARPGQAGGAASTCGSAVQPTAPPVGAT